MSQFVASAVAALGVAAMASASFAANPDCPNLEEVIIVTKCHLDVGYTHTVPELVKRYRTVYMDKALELFDSDRAKPSDLRSRWTMPAWLVDAVLNGQYAPERRERIEESVRERRLMWHAMPYTVETEVSELEEMVRMFSYGSYLSRKFGFDLPRYAKQTDVPDHAWILPTLLAQAGVKFLHMGINGCSKPEFVVSKIPTLCWWEGPDGSRILLGVSPQYGWGETPPKGWRYKTWLAYYMRGDNAGPVSSKEKEDLLRKIMKQLPGVKVRFGDPADFAEAIIAEEKAKPTLPVVRGDMPDTWIHGTMSMPDATILHRRVQGGLVTLGMLDTTLRAFGVESGDVAGLLADGYRDASLYSEHTWGSSGHPVRGPKMFRNWRKRYEAGEYKWFDATFEYHKDYARRSAKTVGDGLASRMAALVRSVDAEGPRVVVFNPLPYERDAVVEVDMPEGRTSFLAKGLPPGGYKTFSAVAGRSPCHVDAGGPPPAVLKTRHFTVRFDFVKGGIASLVENATGRELVKQGGRALGQFLHERFSENDVNRFADAYNTRARNDGFYKKGMPEPGKSPYAALTPKDWTASHRRTELGDEVTMTPRDTLGLAKGYEMRFSFPDHAACVDISWKVTEKKPDPIPEGGWICLPFNVAQPSFRVGRLGGTIDPAKDIVFGANRSMMCVDRAITVRNGARGAGVGVASADLPLWSLGKPGLWLYEPDYVPAEPEVFANLYNNQWTTNFPLWIPGSWSVSLRVYPVAEGADEEQAVFAPSWEIRQPAVAAYADGGGRSPGGPQLPTTAGGVSLSRRGVRVTAFCPNPDGLGMLLRVWEQAGRSGEITVKLPKGMKAREARPVNLRGEPMGEPIAVRDGAFSFALGAWAPKSFVLHDGTEKTAYSRYRFRVDLTGGCGLQISELKLFDGTNDVTRSCVKTSYAAETFNMKYAMQIPPKAVDGSLDTKWFDDRATEEKRAALGGDVWLELEYAKPITVTRYEWHTADDSSRYVGRNPLAWRLQGSNDGVAWADLDVVESAAPRASNKKIAYSRLLHAPRLPPSGVTVYPMRTVDGRRLVSYDVFGTTIRELVPEKDLDEGRSK